MESTSWTAQRRIGGDLTALRSTRSGAIGVEFLVGTSRPLRLAALALALVPIAPQEVAVAASPALPPGFTLIDPFPTASFERPTEIAFLPDGRALVCEQTGLVWTMRADGTRENEPFIDLRDEVLYRVDLGLLSVAVDPDFPSQAWIYLLYTVDPDGDGVDDETDAFGRLTRYRSRTDDPNVADASSRHVLLGASWSSGIPVLGTSHTIGSVRFGEEGSLLVSAGDGAHAGPSVDPGGRDPFAFGPGRTDPGEDVGAFRARSLESLAGKILRLDKDTGFGLPDNPYWDGNGLHSRSRIFVYGLRNPFRFTVRPGTGGRGRGRGTGPGSPGSLYISDVGWNAYEEIDVATAGGINFGWPCDEGPSAQPDYSQVQNVATGNPDVLCSAPPNPEVPDPATPPEVHYHHLDPGLSDPAGWKGRAATGGVFYDGTLYPEHYRGRYFVVDFPNRWIRALEMDPKDRVVGWEDFATGLQDAPSGIFAHPEHGDLYLVATTSGQFWRLVYGDVVGANPPQDPSAGPARLVALRPNPAIGPVSVAFSLPAPATVSLHVFDARGAHIAEVMFENAPAGTSRVSWDGNAADGRRAEPGVYFVRLVTPWGSDARKLVVGEP